MVHHIVYDLWMLREAAHLCGMVVALRLGRPPMCAALESCGIHLRNLLGFLYPVPQDVRSGDIVAADYLGIEPVDETEQVTACEPVREWKRRVSKNLAHVSTERMNPVAWPATELADEVTARFVDFVGHLAPGPFADRFTQELTDQGLAVHFSGAEAEVVDVVGLLADDPT